MECLFVGILSICGYTRESIYCFKLIAYLIVCVVVHITVEMFDGAVDGCFVVRFFAATMTPVFSEDAELDVRIPIAMFYPSPQKLNKAGEFITGDLIA